MIGLANTNRRKSFLTPLLIAVMVAANPCAVWAHAVIVESTPGINGVVKGPAVDIKLRFNSRVDASRSKLTLISPDGAAHALELSPQKSPDALVATATKVLPGKYQLRWQVLASDGHITQGEIPFSVIAP